MAFAHTVTIGRGPDSACYSPRCKESHWPIEESEGEGQRRDVEEPGVGEPWPKRRQIRTVGSAHPFRYRTVYTTLYTTVYIAQIVDVGTYNEKKTPQ
jgi:hypothetical protein